jgi:hypothetical protein
LLLTTAFFLSSLSHRNFKRLTRWSSRPGDLRPLHHYLGLNFMPLARGRWIDGGKSTGGPPWPPLRSTAHQAEPADATPPSGTVSVFGTSAEG